MVDVDRRSNGLTPAHAAGLRRLSTRAASSSSSQSSSSALHSFSSLALTIVSHLNSSSIQTLPGLTDRELSHIEADLGFTFPPDLRALLSLAAPSGAGFPDWRCRSAVRAAFDFPMAAVSLQIAKSSLWPRSWGPRPSDPDRALRAARSAVRRAPLLIPLFDRCYVPCRPCLAGNPVFYVTEERVVCCGLDLLDFFKRDPAFVSNSSSLGLTQQFSSVPSPANMRRSLDMIAGKSPRWIEFWSDAASDRRRRDSSSSDSSTASTSSCTSSWSELERSSKDKPQSVPIWVEGYLSQIESILIEAGWEESDVSEMVHVSASETFDGEDQAVIVDNESVLDALLVKTGRCSDSLRRAGWSSDDVSDALGFELKKKMNRPAVRVPPKIQHKIEALAHSVAGSEF